MPTVAGTRQVLHAADDSTGRGLVAAPGLSRQGASMGQLSRRLRAGMGN